MSGKDLRPEWGWRSDGTIAGERDDANQERLRFGWEAPISQPSTLTRSQSNQACKEHFKTLAQVIDCVKTACTA